MGFSAGVIAGIVVACLVAVFLLSALIAYLINRHRENGAYEDRCSRIWQKYGGKGSAAMATFPHADPSYITTTVPGQQFTVSEVSRGFVIPGKVVGEFLLFFYCFRDIKRFISNLSLSQPL